MHDLEKTDLPPLEKEPPSEKVRMWKARFLTLSALLRRYCETLFDLVTLSEQRKLILLSAAVGLTSGFSAFLFKSLIDGVHHLCCESDLSRQLLSLQWYRPLLPALGGLLTGLLIFHFAREARGHGVTEVIFSLQRRGGRIRPRVALVKTITSALTIGTGGSAGPEGPIIQIGAAIGSSIGQWLNLPAGYLKTLVAAGAAGGIAAVFNAPIAAVIFSMEVLLREFTAQAFSMVVLSSVIASVTSSHLLGDSIFLPTPPFGIQHPAELGLYFLLGTLAALLAKGFVKVFTWTEERFEKWGRAPEPLKPMVGGVLVGAMGLFVPMILGAGYAETTAILLTGSDPARWGFYLIALLMVGKIVSTSLTLGSGGSGGILMPSLFIGAMMGSFFGKVAHSLFPSIASPGAYALVGMGLIFACVVQAPFTAMVLMFEMTHDYRIVIPLMFAITVAMLVSRQIGAVGLDAHLLFKKGVQLEEVGYRDPLLTVTVGEVMVKNVDLVRPDMTLERMIDFIEQNPHTGFPVVNAQGELLGMITYAEVHLAFSSGPPSKNVLVQEMMRNEIPVIHPHESLAEAVQRMQAFRLDRLPVVEEDRPKRLVGLITRSNILSAYPAALRRL